MAFAQRYPSRQPPRQNYASYAKRLLYGAAASTAALAGKDMYRSAKKRFSKTFSAKKVQKPITIKNKKDSQYGGNKNVREVSQRESGIAILQFQTAPNHTRVVVPNHSLGGSTNALFDDISQGFDKDSRNGDRINPKSVYCTGTIRVNGLTHRKVQVRALLLQAKSGRHVPDTTPVDTSVNTNLFNGDVLRRYNVSGINWTIPGHNNAGDIQMTLPVDRERYIVHQDFIINCKSLLAANDGTTSVSETPFKIFANFKDMQIRYGPGQTTLEDETPHFYIVLIPNVGTSEGASEITDVDVTYRLVESFYR